LAQSEAGDELSSGPQRQLNMSIGKACRAVEEVNGNPAAREIPVCGDRHRLPPPQSAEQGE
jgi:hypothetical protein